MNFINVTKPTLPTGTTVLYFALPGNCGADSSQLILNITCLNQENINSCKRRQRCRIDSRIVQYRVRRYYHTSPHNIYGSSILTTYLPSLQKSLPCLVLILPIVFGVITISGLELGIYLKAFPGNQKLQDYKILTCGFSPTVFISIQNREFTAYKEQRSTFALKNKKL